MGTTRIIVGDVRRRVKELADESVHCVVTSPPYYGLRDYGTAQWEGGDNPDCDHRPARLSPTRNENRQTFGDSYATHPTQLFAHGKRKTCDKCGASKTDMQIGLEATPDAYIAEIVAVFREVRRVLRSDGTFWLNLGDSYSQQGKWGGSTGGKHANGLHGDSGSRDRKEFGLPTKQRLMLPARVALALQADGWWLRDEIIWHKPNPMPISVTDRTTPAHEMIYMFSKSPRYFYDMEAVLEPALTAVVHQHWKEKSYDQTMLGTQQSNGVKGRPTGVAGYAAPGKRQPRSVWSIATRPFKGAHFATFPPDLIRPCIKAGCPAGGTVLDPFFGAGTTGLVAAELNRSCIGFELNPEYAAIARERLGMPTVDFTRFRTAVAAEQAAREAATALQLRLAVR